MQKIVFRMYTFLIKKNRFYFNELGEKKFIDAVKKKILILF